MDAVQRAGGVAAYRTPGGIPVRFRVEDQGFLSQRGQATRDPLVLRELLGEVMIRNTRSLVQIDLPHVPWNVTAAFEAMTKRE